MWKTNITFSYVLSIPPFYCFSFIPFHWVLPISSVSSVHRYLLRRLIERRQCEDRVLHRVSSTLYNTIIEPIILYCFNLFICLSLPIMQQLHRGKCCTVCAEYLSSVSPGLISTFSILLYALGQDTSAWVQLVGGTSRESQGEDRVRLGLIPRLLKYCSFHSGLFRFWPFGLGLQSTPHNYQLWGMISFFIL